MKILQITNRIPYPLDDGGNIATYSVTKYLNRFGHEVTMASMNTKKHFQDPEVMSSVCDIRAMYWPAPITFLGMFLGLFKKMPYNVWRFMSKEFSGLLVKLLAEKKFDIIQLEGSYMLLYADLLKQHTAAPVILRSHNIEYQIWGRYADSEGNNLLKKFYLKHLSKQIKHFELQYLHKADGIIAITDQDAEFYRQAGYKKELTVISAGVDMDFVDVVGQKKPIPDSVCFLGSLEWMPNAQGLDWFIEHVWPVIRRFKPHAQLHIAGKNPPERYKNLKGNGIFFHGMVPDAADFVSTYQIVIVPLFSGGGMRLKIVEAMALGKCIVSTPVGAEGIDAAHDKQILLADNAKDFQKNILCLMEEPSRYNRVADNAVSLARSKYDWEILVRQFEKFYFKFK
ncbi:glycosyltransferase family 4 protein [Cytophagaceae bacterium ABcell3]|nr:glycosyltransferase family 4 protein [Cytophagaceae bacterium ABcell3]